ncbi:MAG: hypothetical protein ABW101_07240 [Candidatus Thiodiazotropha sp.]
MELYKSTTLSGWLLILFLLNLNSCGGGDSNPDESVLPEETNYTVGGRVSGLNAAGLFIRNADEEMAIEDNGEFVFTMPLQDGDRYEVIIAAQPSGQTCRLMNAFGFIEHANVTDVLIGCPYVPAIPNISVNNPKQLIFHWKDVEADFYRLLENPDGDSGYSVQVDGITDNWVTDTVSVHLANWANARYILQACSASQECVDSAPVDVAPFMLETIGYLKASDTMPRIWLSEDVFLGQYAFGKCLALSGDGRSLAVAGNLIHDLDPFQLGNDVVDDGKVYLFRYQDGAWHDLGSVEPNLAGGDANFGRSLSLSTDGVTLAVGSPGTNDIDLVTTWDRPQGSVYLFMREGDSWNPVSELSVSSPDEAACFGREVTFSGDGNTLAVSACESVFVFHRQDEIWFEQAVLQASQASNSGGFGKSIHLSQDGMTLAVGAVDSPGDLIDGSAIETQDAVYLFVLHGGAWQEQAYLQATDGDAEDQFGISLDLSATGDILAVGANRESSSSTGAHGDPLDNGSAWAGAVYLFERQQDIWRQSAYLKASNTDPYDLFGSRVVLSEDGHTLAVSAPGEASIAQGVAGDQNNNASLHPPGAVYLFRYRDGDWRQQTYVKASNTDEGYNVTNHLDPSCRPDPCPEVWLNDNFGFSLDLSNDATTLVVGGPSENSGDRFNRDDNSEERSGAVYLY